MIYPLLYDIAPTPHPVSPRPPPPPTGCHRLPDSTVESYPPPPPALPQKCPVSVPRICYNPSTTSNYNNERLKSVINKSMDSMQVTTPSPFPTPSDHRFDPSSLTCCVTLRELVLQAEKRPRLPVYRKVNFEPSRKEEEKRRRKTEGKNQRKEE